MIDKLLEFIFGTYFIKIKCNCPEIVLNKIINNNLKIYNVEKTPYNELVFKCNISTYSKIKAKFKNTEIIIQSENGLPFYFKKYKKRYGLFIGTLIFLLILYFSTLFVWDIQVSGNETFSSEMILNELSKQGFVVGKTKKSYNIKNIQNDFLLENEKISWISINLKGTVAFVEIRENTLEIEELDTSKPSNIYASRDGVIGSITTYMGYKTVNVGDTVTAGDMIVTGNYTDKYGKNYLLHSYAKVMAYTTHSYSVKIPFKAVEQQITGKKKQYFSLKLTRFTIPLYFKENISYNKYSINKSVKKIRLSSSIVLPLSFHTTTYLETEDVVYTKSKEVALMEAYEKLDDIERNLINITVLDKKYEVSEDPDGVTVKVYLDCYEDIGIEKEIA